MAVPPRTSSAPTRREPPMNNPTELKPRLRRRTLSREEMAQYATSRDFTRQQCATPDGQMMMINAIMSVSPAGLFKLQAATDAIDAAGLEPRDLAAWCEGPNGGTVLAGDLP